MLLMRTSMLETLPQDYILTARAKGLREARVVLVHALKSASLPVVTTLLIACITVSVASELLGRRLTRTLRG
jgi:ABC-type dipeptide/oligopeptide/nickel transport system permease component